MDKKLIRRVIICIVIIMIIIIGYLIKIMHQHKEEDKMYDDSESIPIEELIKVDPQNRNIDRISYFDIDSCMNRYLSTIDTNNFIYQGREESQIKESIYNILSESYIKQNNITKDNVYNFVKTKSESTLYVPLEISVIQQSNIKSFLVHGLLENFDLQVTDEIFVVVNIDITNNLFSIEPIYGNYNSINEIKIEKSEDTIKNNENNVFTSVPATYENIAKDYINIYKRLALGRPKIMYNLLNEEYREKRFGSEQEFEKYITSNKDRILGTRLEKYQTISENGIQYVCVDQYDNYYIFNENDVMDYTVLLDQHTIDLAGFTEKYNSARNENKVAMNIEKIKDAINTNDYKYIYDKLDATFRQNNFSTEAELEKYLKDNLYEMNNFEYTNINEQNGLYIFSLLVGDNIGHATSVRNMNIVMQLKEGTDFVMSFSIEK